MRSLRACGSSRSLPAEVLPSRFRDRAWGDDTATRRRRRAWWPPNKLSGRAGRSSGLRPPGCSRRRDSEPRELPGAAAVARSSRVRLDPSRAPGRERGRDHDDGRAASGTDAGAHGGADGDRHRQRLRLHRRERDDHHHRALLTRLIRLLDEHVAICLVDDALVRGVAMSRDHEEPVGIASRLLVLVVRQSDLLRALLNRAFADVLLRSVVDLKPRIDASDRLVDGSEQTLVLLDSAGALRIAHARGSVSSAILREIPCFSTMT